MIPTVMLRPYTEDFLDGHNLTYVKEQTGKTFMFSKISILFKKLLITFGLYKGLFSCCDIFLAR